MGEIEWLQESNLSDHLLNASALSCLKTYFEIMIYAINLKMIVYIIMYKQIKYWHFKCIPPCSRVIYHISSGI